ncbi:MULTISPECIES: hypothetical protein [unclassified Microcoleus]|uniref:hypothetical protein n=1 Tax=unclassified Microcoleus TaxID=2642155 RepID=UPI002FD582A9
MLQPQNPREYDAILGGQTPPSLGAMVLGGLPGVRSRLASSHLASQIGAMSEACRYGEPGFDLIVQFLRDNWNSIDSTVKSAGKDTVAKMLNNTVTTDYLGWYLVSHGNLDFPTKTDTLHLACDKLLAYIHTVYPNTKWYLSGGYSYITFSQVHDREWAKGNRKTLNDSIDYLVQILTAEKLRRVRILQFVYYSQSYYDICLAYQKEMYGAKFVKKIKSRLTPQSIYHSLLPWFEESLEKLIASD